MFNIFLFHQVLELIECPAPALVDKCQQVEQVLVLAFTLVRSKFAALNLQYFQ